MSIIPDYKTITDLLKKGLTLEAQEKIMELREAAVELKSENAALKDQNAKLKNKLSLKAKTVFERPYYFVLAGKTKEGPYCQRCFDKDQDLIRLQSFGNGTWICCECKSKFFDKNFVPPKRSVAITSLRF
jgi:regulator of replication initiation timing